jgi:hypothetical protein
VFVFLHRLLYSSSLVELDCFERDELTSIRGLPHDAFNSLLKLDKKMDTNGRVLAKIAGYNHVATLLISGACLYTA